MNKKFFKNYGKQSVSNGSDNSKQKSFLIFSLSVILIYFVIIYSPSLDIEFFYSRCPKTSFVEALFNRSAVDRFIILALVDTAFVDMAINLYKASFFPHKISNFLFVGASKKTCQILSNSSLPCYHYGDDPASGVASIYKSSDFIRKMNMRTEMILDALSLGFTVLHTDLDVYFFSNPLTQLKIILEESDMTALWDSSSFNAGFIAMKPSKSSIEVYKRTKQFTDSSKTTDDQTALNSAINQIKKINSDFKISVLNKNKFLCGFEYFEVNKRLFPSRCPGCVVLHNNWIVSKEAKIYRFKEHLMWMLNDKEYYSNKSSLYLTYSNNLNWNQPSLTLKEELTALKTALQLSAYLGRKLILPRFHCFKKIKEKRSIKIFNMECPLNGLINISLFDQYFFNQYRENSFLKHPLVPEEVKKNISSPIYISKTFLLTLNNSEALPEKHKQVILNITQISNLTSIMDYKVLVFKNLYDLQLAPESQLIPVERAFQKTTYRQFPVSKLVTRI